MNNFGKYLLLATGFALLGFVLLATFARIPRAIINVHADNRGCSVASLKGRYAYRRTGVNNVVGGPIAEIGIDVFNGDGTRGLLRLTEATTAKSKTGPPISRRTEIATRLIRIVPGRYRQMAQKPTTWSSLTEARDSS